MAGVAAVLTAAGESTRMGRPKPLLPWNGDTLVGSQVCSLANGGICQIIVVLGHAALDVVAHVRGAKALRILINPIYRQGRTTSIRMGLGEVSRDADAVLLLAVDQPRPAELIRQVLQEHADSGALITMPSYQGRGGHPVVFQRSLLSELLEISEKRQGVREVMERHRDEVHRLEVNSPVVRLDFNTWTEYQEALALYAAPSAGA